MALTKLTQSLIDGTLVTSVNGNTGAVTTGIDWQSAIKTSNFTAVAGKGYFVNTTSGEITVTLPAGAVGSEIAIQDYAGTFATNKVMFASNGSEKIQGITDDFECSINNATITLIYQDATKGWTSDNITVVIPPLTVSYLVVAGAGSGGGVKATGGYHAAGGGGGAGGYRTNYGGTALTLTAGTNYTVTVGAGAPMANQLASSGSNSTFSTIISAGGGGGFSGGSSQAAQSGGSGGGGGRDSTAAGAGNTPSTTPSQGNDGGVGNATHSQGGGGGGAGQTGQNGNTISGVGGNGGDGLSNSITGTATFYAGGGGGSNGNLGSTSTISTGGQGGGGNGVVFEGGYYGNAGASNTGGGGGGSCAYYNATNTAGGAGGSGIVILRYPSGYTISGLSGTTTTVGTDKVTVFTSGTGNIQWN